MKVLFTRENPLLRQQTINTDPTFLRERSMIGSVVGLASNYQQDKPLTNQVIYD